MTTGTLKFSDLKDVDGFENSGSIYLHIVNIILLECSQHDLIHVSLFF